MRIVQLSTTQLYKAINLQSQVKARFVNIGKLNSDHDGQELVNRHRNSELNNGKLQINKRRSINKYEKRQLIPKS